MTLARTLAVLLALTMSVSAAAATRTWSGAVDNRWSVAGNWRGGVAPRNGDVIAIPGGAAHTTMVNDLSGLTIQSVTVDTNVFPHVTYEVSGNPLTVLGGVTNGTWRNDLRLGATQTFRETNVAGTVDLNGHTLGLDEVTVDGSIAGTGELAALGRLVVNGTIDIGGTLRVHDEELRNNGTIVSPVILNDASDLASGTFGSLTMVDTDLEGPIRTGDFSMSGGGFNRASVAAAGTVTLDQPFLNVFVPETVGATVVLIDNDGTDPIQGTFHSLPEGATYHRAQITYQGGSGNDAVLTVITPAPPVAGPLRWTGAMNSLWSVGGNWSGGVAPADGDILSFQDSVPNRTAVNDLTNLSPGAIIVTDGYSISGNPLTLTERLYLAQCTWRPSTTLAGPLLFSIDGATFGTVDLNGQVLTLGASGLTEGNIVGTGNVNVTNSSDVPIRGTWTFDGQLQITTFGPGKAIFDGSVTAPARFISKPAPPISVIFNPPRPPGALGGSGTFGPLAAGGIVNPGGVGKSTGILRTGNLQLFGTLQFDLAGPAPGSGHDQLAVSGSVTLDSVQLALFPHWIPVAGQQFVLIDNDGTDPINGTVPSTVTAADGLTFSIATNGGDGNDLVATVVSAPKGWTGAIDNRWSAGGNWNDGTPPANGDALVFPSTAANRVMVNDLHGLSIASAIFRGDAWKLSGNALTLGGLENHSASLEWAPERTIVSGSTWILNQTLLEGTIELSGGTYRWMPYQTTLRGALVGRGQLTLHHLYLTFPLDSLDVIGTIAFDGPLNAGVTTLTIDGASSSPIIDGGISAKGSLGTVNTSRGLSPGAPRAPATLRTGSLTLRGAYLFFDFDGTPAGAHDRLIVTGTVTLTNNPTLGLNRLNMLPLPGTPVVVIDNDGTDPVTGTFKDLPEGTTSGWFRISYQGGTGNDVVVTAVGDATTVALTATPGPGTNLTLTARVTSASGAIPSGTVTFLDRDVPLATIALDDAGVATFVFTPANDGHVLAARYNGDVGFVPSTSPPLALAGEDIPALSTWALFLMGALLAAIALRLLSR